MRGTLTVATDLPFDTARDFAARNGLVVTRTDGATRTTLLGLAFRSHDQYLAGLRALADLGWDRREVTVNQVIPRRRYLHGEPPPGTTPPLEP